MTVLVLGASGATGRRVVELLLARGLSVRAIVRSPERFLDSVGVHESLSVVHASILDLADDVLAQHLLDCSAVVSCLGHNLSFKGVYGEPRRLVTEATRRVCSLIKVLQFNEPVKFILMNSTGCRNPDLGERISFAETCVVGLIRYLVPPHADNESAIEYLREVVGGEDSCVAHGGGQGVEWVAVRPDSLVDESLVSDYRVCPSPTRSAIFNAGKSSRINVAHFMAELVTDDALWRTWRGKTPVIYNVQS